MSGMSKQRAFGGSVVAAGVAFICLAAWLPHGFWTAYAGMAVFLFGVVVGAGLPLRRFAAGVLRAAPFALAVASLWLFQKGGVTAFASLLAKAGLCVGAVNAVAMLVPFGELLALLRRWGVPVALVTTLALLERYRVVLLNELQRLVRARASRTFTARHGWRARSELVARLFVRSVERSERVHAAMQARGWEA